MHSFLRPLFRESTYTTLIQRRSLSRKVLTLGNINTNIAAARYDVRGEIYLAAVQRTQEGKEVIYTNIGNPHALGQKPVTFTRQVLALLMAPFLLDKPGVEDMFPPDAIARARLYLSHMKGGMGAYTDSKGVPYIRQEVANFIAAQSQLACSPDNIFLSNGASEVARLMLMALIKGPSCGVMVPIPQYPLYSASIALYGGQLVPYYLDEGGGWSLSTAELRRALGEARLRRVDVKAMVFINPGNPTGQCLSEGNLKDVLSFCRSEGIVAMADEVYQENIYNAQRPFVSARKVLGAMDKDTRQGLELVSMHSTSKGMVGECGLRGGYMELLNVGADVMDELYKLSAINLCSNLPGQVAMGLMVNPPKAGEPSHGLYAAEIAALHGSLKRRAERVTRAFNAMPGVSCQPTEGAMYAFPSIALPPRFVQHAQAQGKAPDVLYCLSLLHETGLCCVPGSGFQQKPGTFHFRTTILPQEAHFEDILARFAAFHAGLFKRWA